MLLGLGHALDLFEEVRDPFHLLSKGYENMYGWVPAQYKKHNFNHLIWRTLKAGYIEKIEKEGKIYIRITSQGTRRTQRDFPLMHFQNKSWDGKWRIVMFDISEIQKLKRDYLRDKLKELGFGMLQESVFITPHDIIKDFSEYVESIDLMDSVDILEASYILGDPKEVAERVWKLGELNKKYLEILQEAQKMQNIHLIKDRGRGKQLNINTQMDKENHGDHEKQGKHGDHEKQEKQEKQGKNEKHGRHEKYEKVSDLKEKYLSLLIGDPFLPKEVLPKNYCRDQVTEFIKKLF